VFQLNEFSSGLLKGSGLEHWPSANEVLLPQGMRSAFLCFNLWLWEDFVKHFFPLYSNV